MWSEKASLRSLQIIVSFTNVCSRLAKSADSEGKWNYIRLYVQLMLHEKCHHTVLIISRQIIQLFLKRRSVLKARSHGAILSECDCVF